MSDSPNEMKAVDEKRTAALTLLAFLIFVLTNGSAPVMIRITFEEMTPLWSGGIRFLLAGMILWVVVAVRRVRLPRGKALRGALLFGILSTGISPIMLLFGLANLPSSLYQTLLAMIPLITLFLATAHGQERISRWGIIGALVAIGGTMIAVGGVRGTNVSMVYILLVFAGSAAMAEAGVIARGIKGVQPIALNAIGLTVGGLIVLVASLIMGDPWVIPTTARVWLAFWYTAIFAVVIGFLLYIHVLQQWSASKTSYSFLLTPLVTAVVATVLAGEHITPVFMAGTVLVLAGVYIGAFVNKPTPIPVPVNE